MCGIVRIYNQNNGEPDTEEELAAMPHIIQPMFRPS